MRALLIRMSSRSDVAWTAPKTSCGRGARSRACCSSRSSPRRPCKIRTTYHCCPVNGRVAALKATDSASLGAKRGVRDLNSEHSLEIFQGGSREHRQDPFCSIDGVSAVEDIRPDRCAVWRRRPGADAELWRAIPGQGVCPTDLPGEFAGYRDVPFRSGVEALPHGLARTASALDAGRCQRSARLAHLRGSGAAVDRPGEEAVRHGGSWSGPDQYGLRLGFDNHRPVPVGLSVGSFPHHQGGGEDAHPARFARQHPELHSRVGRQTGRRACARSAASRSRCHLCYGSWLCRFRPPSCVASGGGLLRDAHQIEHECPSGLLRADGSHDRHHLRPVHCPGWPLHQQELPRAVAARPLQGCRIWQDTGVSEQSFRSSSPDHCRPLQKPMASGVVLQVDQAAPADQAVYGTSENAVKTQIWIAVSVYVLVAIVRKRLDLDASLYTLLQIFSVTLLEKN